MEIFFRRRELQALCNSRTALERRWGLERAALLAQRLHELAALDCLADLDHLPHVAFAPQGRGILVAVDKGLAVKLAAPDGQAPLSRAQPHDVKEVVIEDLTEEGGDAQ